MANLIIVVISIVLVAAMTIAMTYYGGSAYSDGSTRAGASGAINAAQQIAGAAAMYAVQHGAEPTDIAGAAGSSTLVGRNFLTSVPAVHSTLGASPVWSLNDGAPFPAVVLTGITSARACSAINREAGVAEDGDSGLHELGGADAAGVKAAIVADDVPYGCGAADWDVGPFIFVYRY